MEEKWIESNIAEGYEVSSEGRVRNSKTGRILIPCLDNKGYETVKVKENGRRITKRVGRLVADAFLDGEPGKPCVSYIDGNKRNNRINNLERRRCNKRIRIVETGEVYDSIRECSKAIGMNESTISKCCNYDFYNNTKGLHFESVD